MRTKLRNSWFFLILFLAACAPAVYEPDDYPEVDRLAALPVDIEKVTPEDDNFPPILHSDE